MRYSLGLRVAVTLLMFAFAVISCNSPTEPLPPPTAQSARDECNSTDLKIGSFATYTDAADYSWIIGTIKNTSSIDLLLARICVLFVNNDTPQKEYRYIGPLLIKPGETVAFRAVLGDLSPAARSSVQLAADAQLTSVNPQLASGVSRDFQIGELIPYRRLDNGLIVVNGVITNTGKFPVRNIYVSVGLYNDKGALVGVAAGKITELEPLLPNQAIPFTVFTNYLVSPVTEVSTRLIAEGQIIQDSIEAIDDKSGVDDTGAP